MAITEAEASQNASGSSGGSVYDGFISYSHAADDLLAPRLQAGLQRFAKPWWKRRALRIFRDESSLSANPHLWSSITDALDGSDWFVLLLSPDAASSEWVGNEVEYWLEHKDPERIIPVLTDGEFGWADGDVAGDAALPALRRAFADEPRWVDLRFARTEDQLDLNNPAFSAVVADIASPIRRIPKDELLSEEVRQHRRTVRTAWAAGFVVLLLAVAASVAAFVAFNEQQRANDEAERANQAAAAEEAQRQVAEDERDTAQAERDRADEQARIARAEALGAYSISVLGDDPELSVLLAGEALETDPRPVGADAMHRALQGHRTIMQVTAPGEGVGTAVGGLSPDGRLLVTGWSGGSELAVWDVDGAGQQWSRVLIDDGKYLVTAAFDVDGSTVVAYVGSFDFIEFEFQHLDTTTGELIRVMPAPDCSGWHYWPGVVGPYVDLTLPMPWVRDLDCDQFGTTGGELGTLDPLSGDYTPLRELRGSLAATVGSPTSDAARRVLAVDDAEGERGLILDIATGQVLHRYAGGIATLSADGRFLLEGGLGTEVRLALRDLSDDTVLWRFPAEGDVFTRAWFSLDETLVYATNFDGTTYVLDAATGVELHRLRGHTGFQREAVMSADNSRIATFAADGTARVWDIGSPIRAEAGSYSLFSGGDPGREHGLKSLDVAAGMAAAFAGTATGQENEDWWIAVVDLGSGEVVREVPGGSPSLSPNGELLAYRHVAEAELPAELTDGQAASGVHPVVENLRIVEVASGETVSEIPVECHTYLVEGDAITAGGCEGKEELPDWQRVWDLEWSPDGSSLAMVDGGDRRVSVADVASGEVVWTSDYVGPLGAASAFAVAFSSDGAYLAIAYPVANVITVHDTEQFALVAEIPVPDNIFDLEFTNDGRWLVAGDVQGLVVAVDTTVWAEPAELRAHRASAVFHLSSSPSGEHLASLSGDGVVVWNTDDWSVLTSIPLLAALGVEFIDETHLLVIPIHPSDAYVLTLDPVHLLLAGRQALTRSFTETECATYGIEPCPTTLDELRGG